MFVYDDTCPTKKKARFTRAFFFGNLSTATNNSFKTILTSLSVYCKIDEEYL